jgi:hypothetical protein
MRQAGQSKKMAEARLSFEERKTILKFSWLNTPWLLSTGTLKDVVYRRKPATLAVLWEEIETACAAIHVDTLVSVAQAALRRNQKCLDADGNHFEHLL